MNISEDELRAMVRDAVTRQSAAPTTVADAPRPTAAHASHGLIFAGGGGGDEDGRCLIEPSVACTHCGYCQSLGH